MKKKRILSKRKAFCIVLLLLLCSLATAQDSYVVTATKLNVRKAASAESSIVGSLSKGDHVDVYNFKGGWAEIGFKNGTAFVAKKFLEKIEDKTTIQLEKQEPATPTPSFDEPTTQVTVKKKKERPDGFEIIGFANVYFKFGKNSTYIVNSEEAGIIFPGTYGFLPFSPESCVFATAGFGFSIYSYSESFSYMGYYSHASSLNVSLLLPLHAGIRIGGFDAINGTVQVGITPSITVHASANNETIHMPFGDRLGIGGSIRGTLAYKRYGLLAEYMFPFQSGAKGTFLFGVSISASNRQ